MDDYITIPRDVYEKLMVSYGKGTCDTYDNRTYNNNGRTYENQPFVNYTYEGFHRRDTHGYGHSHSYDDGPSEPGFSDGYSLEPYRPPVQTPRPQTAGPVSRSLYHQDAIKFFRNEIQTIDQKFFNSRSRSGKTIIIDSTILFGRFYMKGDQVLGNKSEELIRDLSLLWLQYTGYIMVEVASGWKDDYANKSIVYLIGYKTKKGKAPIQMTKSEIDTYLVDHPVWNEQRKFKLFHY